MDNKYQWLIDYWNSKDLHHHVFNIQDILATFPTVESTGYTNRKYTQWCKWYFSNQCEIDLNNLKSIQFKGSEAKVISGEKAELCLTSLDLSMDGNHLNAILTARASIVNGALLLDLQILASKLKAVADHHQLQTGTLTLNAINPGFHNQSVGHLLKIDHSLLKSLCDIRPAIGKQIWLMFKPEYFLKSGLQWVTFNTINSLDLATKRELKAWSESMAEQYNWKLPKQREPKIGDGRSREAFQVKSKLVL